MKRLILVLLAALLLVVAGCGGMDLSQPGATLNTTQSTGPLIAVPTQPTTAGTWPTAFPTWPTTVPTQPTAVPTWPTTMPAQPSVPVTIPISSATEGSQPATVPTPPTPTVPLPELEPGTTWEVHGCDSFITLRKRPDVSADSIRIISKGETVELLGWYGRFAKVRYAGRTGYVAGGFIKPADAAYMEDALNTVRVTDIYTYDEMMEDLIAFEQAYPAQVELEIVGYSEWGTQIPVLRIGNEDAQHHVLLHGSIHAREYYTTWLLMAMVDYWLDRDLESYGDICYHIIPMVNPDGVSIAQSGVLPEELMEIYRSDVKNGYTTDDLTEYARNWKANGLGVDLNRNFSTNWQQEDARSSPSSERYRGTEPFSAAEAKLLRDYTQKYPFAATVSYHATGSVIYYEYGWKQPVNSLSKSLAKELSELTGYYTLGHNDAEPTGYKDWAIDSLGIPSVTMEIGSGAMPLDERELHTLFARNCDTLRVIAQWLK